MKITAKQIVEITKGKLLNGDLKSLCLKISTDTRKISENDLYVALNGPHFDGHDFINQAISKKACGCIVSKKIKESYPKDFIVIQVKDTQKALGDIAHFVRKKTDIPIIAITGSSGKTTTKEMLSACLKVKGSVNKTQGNLNNLIGLPQTVFTLSEKDDFAVWEMGMNSLGEIKRLAQIAQPDVGLITNVGQAHLEGLGSIEGVAKAKGELFSELSSKAVAIVNQDDDFIPKMKTKAKKITYGFSPDSDYRCENFEVNDSGTKVIILEKNNREELILSAFGEHMVYNLLSVVAICRYFKMSFSQIQKGLNQFKVDDMRGGETKLADNILIINDTYNANPNSMEASMLSLKMRFPLHRKVAILGDMLELGEDSGRLHLEIGKYAAQNDIAVLIALGEFSENVIFGYEKESGKEGFAYKNLDQLFKELHQKINHGDKVLIKGSRGSKMERVVDFLKERKG